MMRGGGLSGPKPTIQNVSPNSGDTVSFINDGLDRILYITPSVGLAVLTIQMPSDSGSVIGQKVSIASSKAVISLTMSGGTILNTTLAFVANDCFTYMKISANTWILCQ